MWPAEATSSGIRVARQQDARRYDEFDAATVQFLKAKQVFHCFLSVLYVPESDELPACEWMQRPASQHVTT
jgi:hypothetical protein